MILFIQKRPQGLFAIKDALWSKPMKITSLLSDKPYSTRNCDLFCYFTGLAMAAFIASRFEPASVCLLGHFDRQDHVLGIGGFST